MEPGQARRHSKRSPLAFVVVVLGLAIPIWGLSRFVGVIEALKVPVTDLMLAFTPFAAGAVLVLWDEGLGGLVRLLKGALDVGKLARSGWLPTALLLAPLAYLLTYVALHLAGHSGVARINWIGLPVVAVIVLLLAIGEEAGWTGYLLDPLQDRFGALGASLIIAVPWWLGHIPSILEIGGSVADLAWWLPGAIALRVLMTWLYNSSGHTLSATVLFHMMLNVGRMVTYPTIGSHYDPFYQATGYIIFSMIAVLVAATRGARTLMGRRERAPVP